MFIVKFDPAILNQMQAQKRSFNFSEIITWPNAYKNSVKTFPQFYLCK